MASFKQDGCQGTRGLRCPGGRFLVAHAPLGQPGRGAPEVAAVTIGRTDTALDAFRRRLSARIGKVKAITATAQDCGSLYNALHHGMDYIDPGASSYETRYRTRVIGNLRRHAKAFFVLQPTAPVAVS